MYYFLKYFSKFLSYLYKIFLLSIIKVPVIIKSNDRLLDAFLQFIFCWNEYEYSLNIHTFL